MSKITRRDAIDNLPLKKSRKKLNEGDVFAMKIYEDFHILGQVIKTNINSYDRGVDCLIVFYKIKSKELSIPDKITTLDNIGLLVDRPFLVNKTLWASGIFQNIDNISIPKEIGSFYFYSLMKNGVVDESGNLAYEYSDEKKFTDYGITSLGGILNSIRKVYDQIPDWFEIK